MQPEISIASHAVVATTTSPTEDFALHEQSLAGETLEDLTTARERITASIEVRPETHFFSIDAVHDSAGEAAPTSSRRLLRRVHRPRRLPALVLHLLRTVVRQDRQICEQRRHIEGLERDRRNETVHRLITGGES